MAKEGIAEKNNGNLAIIGSGYVGLVTGACFAELGNNVICVDNDESKIEKLKKGIMPIFEPGLESLVLRNSDEKRLSFTSKITDAVENSEAIFICVGTPPLPNGEPDLTAIDNVAKEIAKAADRYKLIVEKSTVPVKTAEWLKKSMAKYIKTEFDIAVNPEFLREGSAINDFMNPDRIVIGTESEKADSILSSLYKQLNAPILHTDINSAEIIKHASNAMLAQRISTINLIAQLCDKTGANIETVAKGVGMDKRIGQEFLKAGIGYGGFCFPKDLEALISTLRNNNIDASLFESVREINNYMQQYFIEKIENSVGIEGRVFGVLGLSFKPNTDDMRLAPSINVITSLLNRKAFVKAYDPKAMENAKKIFGEKIAYCSSAYETAENADALLILTEWQDFKNIDLVKIKALLKNPVLFDGRNVYSRKRMENLGFEYYGIGR